jgi:hypothetical protein
LAVTALLPDLSPPILLDQANRVPDFHRTSLSAGRRAQTDLRESARENHRQVDNSVRVTARQKAHRRAVQTRRLDRLERLNSLSPQRQNGVRQSMKGLQQLPDDEKKKINQEMNRYVVDDGQCAPPA